MSTMLRRYEILLPRRSNEGTPFPDEMLGEVLLELRRQFGAVSSETQVIQGLWTQAQQVFRDELTRVFVDVDDTAEAREFFLGFKETLKSRFQQLDIWMTSHPVERH
jgi:hypothetical protein